jgi:AraC family transcriptional regulator of adaptative response/methylated-DNA-[protein]-cysteine methyltransferase
MGLNALKCWEAVENKDSTADGQFLIGVVTTGIYCRPSCPARRPLRKNVRFYESPAVAEAAGLRACKRCRPAALPHLAAVARKARTTARRSENG